MNNEHDLKLVCSISYDCPKPKTNLVSVLCEVRISHQCLTPLCQSCEQDGNGRSRPDRCLLASNKSNHMGLATSGDEQVFLKRSVSSLSMILDHTQEAIVEIMISSQCSNY